jgi:hypothetical protein
VTPGRQPAAAHARATIPIALGNRGIRPAKRELPSDGPVAESCQLRRSAAGMIGARMLRSIVGSAAFPRSRSLCATASDTTVTSKWRVHASRAR